MNLLQAVYNETDGDSLVSRGCDAKTCSQTYKDEICKDTVQNGVNYKV